jgi:hypothetical protein
MGLYSKATKRKTFAEKSKRELEKELDRVFSEYVRLRDADDNGWVRCITCGNAYPWKGTSNLHNGHYISRDVKALPDTTKSTVTASANPVTPSIQGGFTYTGSGWLKNTAKARLKSLRERRAWAVRMILSGYSRK